MMRARGWLCRLRAVFRKRKRRDTSGSGSRYSPSCKYRLLSSVVVVSMMWLTWTPGLMNISVEGGPERKLYGP